MRRLIPLLLLPFLTACAPDPTPTEPPPVTLTQEETYTALIPPSTTYIHDNTLPAGMTQIRTPGRDGQTLLRAQVTYIDGTEINRTVLEETILTPATDQIIALGTGQEEETPTPIIDSHTITLPTGEVLTYTDTTQVLATAYTHTDAGCDFYTATGTRVRIGTVAVDPTIIPYGTRMFIQSNDGAYTYGICVAEDCGGAIKGDRVDLYYPTYGDCIAFGKRDCTIYFLG